MIPPLKSKWRCPRCGKTKTSSRSLEINENPPICEKCNVKMDGGPIKKGGPFSESSLKKY